MGWHPVHVDSNALFSQHPKVTLEMKPLAQWLQGWVPELPGLVFLGRATLFPTSQCCSTRDLPQSSAHLCRAGEKWPCPKLGIVSDFLYSSSKGLGQHFLLFWSSWNPNDVGRRWDSLQGNRSMSRACFTQPNPLLAPLMGCITIQNCLIYHCGVKCSDHTPHPLKSSAF